MHSVAIVWHRLGPYHLARLRAASPLGRVIAVEMSGEDNRYAWEKVPGQDGFERHTIFPNADCDTLDPKMVRQRLQAKLDDLKPDVVFVPSWGENFAVATLDWSLKTNTANVLMIDSSRGDKKRTWWKEMVKSMLAHRFQGGIVAGSRHADYIASLGVPRERIWPGYDVVDNAHFEQGANAARAAGEQERSRLGLPSKYFVSVSRFIGKKNVPSLLKAFSRFRREYGGEAGDWHLVVLGDGPMKGEIQSQCRSLGLEGSVHLPGFKQYDELPKYYGLAEAFVLASTEEQWGLVVNEAMASGLGVLISDRCGCAPDLVEQGINGFRFNAWDEEELARLMGQVAGDDAKRREMGRESLRIIGNWSPRTFGENLWKAAEASLAQPPPRHTLASRVLLPMLMRRRNIFET